MSDEQFEKWQKQWDDACETQEFKSAPKPPQTAPSDFFGQYNSSGNTNLDNVDVQYWKDVYNSSFHSGDAPDPLTAADNGLLSEDDDKKKYGDAAKMVSRAQNPVYPNTGGKDQEIDSDRMWSEVDDLKELSDLKNRLMELESKYSVQEVEGKSTASPQKQIDELRKRIDKLSDAMSGTRFEPDQP